MRKISRTEYLKLNCLCFECHGYLTDNIGEYCIQEYAVADSSQPIFSSVHIKFDDLC